jgi:hypothetical protein
VSERERENLIVQMVSGLLANPSLVKSHGDLPLPSWFQAKILRQATELTAMIRSEAFIAYYQKSVERAEELLAQHGSEEPAAKLRTPFVPPDAL